MHQQNTFIPAKMSIIIYSIVPDAKIPGICPEIVMIDKGNRTKDQTVNQYNDQKRPMAMYETFKCFLINKSILQILVDLRTRINDF